MQLLNIGCGDIFHPAWVNIDIDANASEVRSYDLRRGLPYPDNHFDVCYSSHLLEHLTASEAIAFLGENRRVLKPEGIIRVVVPDLESIASTYLHYLEKVSSGDLAAANNYDWIMLELYDQSLRNFSGGEMGKYLNQTCLENKDFLIQRVGKEVDSFITAQQVDCPSIWQRIKSRSPEWLWRKFRLAVAKLLVGVIAGKSAKSALEIGLFRTTSGEVHQWMYDRFSLTRMLEQAGFTNVTMHTPTESQIPDFASYELDVRDGKILRPNSLYAEGIVPCSP